MGLLYCFCADLMRSKGVNPFFQACYLFDGAFHGDVEGMDGTFQSLEKVHLHHANQKVLPA